MLSRIELIILMAMMNFHLTCVQKFSRPSKKDTSMIATGEEYEEFQHQLYNDLEVQANVEKDLKQNRPGMTKFRSPAAKKPKPGSEEVSRIRSFLENIFVYHPSLFAHS